MSVEAGEARKLATAGGTEAAAAAAVVATADS